jgi:hypothetical protein
MTVGVTVFGTIQNNLFVNNLKDAFAGMGGKSSGVMNLDPRQIFEAGQRSKIPDAILNKIIDAMSSSITFTFMIALIPIAAAAVTVLFMGKARVTSSGEKITTSGKKAEASKG